MLMVVLFKVNLKKLYQHLFLLVVLHSKSQRIIHI